MFEVAPFGQYTLLSRLAVGGMAELFVAHDGGDYGPRMVVIKRVLPELAVEGDFIKMFVDEARIVSTLQHEGIVGLLDFGSVDESYFIAMEYVEGADVAMLDEAARQAGKPLSAEESVWIVERAFRGLEFAHNRSDTRGRPLRIVHRDVSPENLLVSVDGRVQITDFGIAKAAQRLAVTRVGMVKGKAGYMSPELVTAKPLDHRHDLFSGGIILWQLLAGRPIYGELSDAAIVQKLQAEPLPPPSQANKAIPPELDAMVGRLLALDPDKRYQTAAAAAAELALWLSKRGFTDGKEKLARRVKRHFGVELDRRRAKLGTTMMEQGLVLPASEQVEKEFEVEVSVMEPSARDEIAVGKGKAQVQSRSSGMLRSALLGVLGALVAIGVVVVWWLLQ